MIDFDKLAADLAKATPGPWAKDHYGYLRAPDGGWVYECESGIVTASFLHPEALANTALRNAAPDLARIALLVPELREALAVFDAPSNWRFGGVLDVNSPSFIGLGIARAALAKLDALLEGK